MPSLLFPPLEKPALNDEDICAQGREDHRQIVEAESQLRIDGRYEWDFSHGRQWDSVARNARETDPYGARPCITLNMVGPMILKLENEFRLARSAVNVLPVDSGADPETAEVLHGIYMDIEHQSRADIAVDVMLDAMYRTGRGYLRVCLEFDHPGSFNKVPRIKSVPYWDSVFLDASHQEPDGSDSKHGLIMSEMRNEEFKQKYPGKKLINYEGYGQFDTYRNWFFKDHVKIAEYYYIEEHTVEIVLLKNGLVRLMSDMKTEEQKGLIVKDRKTTIPQVWHILMSGADVLEKRAWDGQYIPIVECQGIADDVNGRKALHGFTHGAINAQQAYNYNASISEEVTGSMPRSPWIGVAGTFENFEPKWDNVNQIPFSYLEWTQVAGLDGIVREPHRINAEAPIQAITQQRLLARQDLHAVTGVFPLAQGEAQGAERGQEALRRLQTQSDTSNAHLAENVKRSVRFLGAMVVDLIVRHYNFDQVVRIFGEDLKPSQVQIGRETKFKGQKKFFDLSAGRYDVRVAPGPSFATLREQGTKDMVDFTKAYPESFPLIGDLVVGGMDSPNAEEAAARIKRGIDPKILGEEEQTPEQLQALLAQSQKDMQSIEAFAKQQQERVEELTQEVELSKLRLADKDQDHDAARGRLDLDGRALDHKIAIDRAKLTQTGDLKTRELDIDEAEVVLDAVGGE